MYVAAVLPYVMLLALLIRGSLLPGAVDGVTFYLVPKWDKLLDWQVRHHFTGPVYAGSVCARSHIHIIIITICF